VIVGWPLGGELPGGSSRLLVESTAGVAAGRLTVALRSQPDGVDPRRLAFVLLS
jgi:hypothetical protein